MKPYLLIWIGLVLFSLAAPALEKPTPPTDNDVHHRVQKAVPYDLDQTLQEFSKTVHGGVQHVIAKSADDARQIKLIQDHLRKLADAFRKGDFSASERVHGATMPGLVQLKTAQPDDIRFDYKALPNGAQIHYATEYPHYVQALHEWFDAQIHDHGNDLIPGHTQHHSTVAE
jgi:hypothetical protein